MRSIDCRCSFTATSLGASFVASDRRRLRRPVCEPLHDNERRRARLCVIGRRRYSNSRPLHNKVSRLRAQANYDAGDDVIPVQPRPAAASSARASRIDAADGSS